MKILPADNITFQRALTPCEKRKAADLHPKIQQVLGHTGENMLILHNTSLPAAPDKDTGIGYLCSKTGLDYIREMKSLLGLTSIQLHPQGEYFISSENKFCCPYSGTALSLGEHLIYPEALTTKEFGKLLVQSDIENIIKANTAPNKADTANFENILRSSSSSMEKALRTAFEHFCILKDAAPLKKEYKIFVSKNNDWLEPIGIYRVLEKKYKTHLHKWTETLDKNLYNTDWDSKQREIRINEIKKNSADEIEFYKFKQFLADKMLAKSKKEINDMGIKLNGDCQIGWGDELEFAYPKAFMKNKNIGWGLHALDYDTILDPSSDAARLLKRKTALDAARYDAIRFDATWSYLMPAITDKNTDITEHRALHTDAVLKMIEDAVKSVKGDNYNLKNIYYEFEAAAEDFPLNAENRRFISSRMKIYTMQYMSQTWGDFESFTNRIGFSPDSLILGLGNQDSVPQKNFASMKNVDFDKISDKEKIRILTGTFGGKEGDLAKQPQLIKKLIDKYRKLYSLKTIQAKILAKRYNIGYEVLINHPEEFSKYKAAESFKGQNTMYYFMDVLGSSKVFDAKDLNSYENYRCRIPSNYLQEYNTAVQEGFGINMFDIYEKRFTALGMDKTHPKLFAEIQKFNKILKSPPKTIKFSLKQIAGGALVILSAGSALLGLYWHEMRKEGCVKTHLLPEGGITVRNPFLSGYSELYLP